MNTQRDLNGKQGFRFSMFLVTIGIVYGDIGTSPLYVMKSIVAGNGGIGQVDEPFIIGSLSLVIWTVTLLTTVKFILIALKADNHGEGGIFALYSLVKNCGKWLIIPAMVGGAALLQMNSFSMPSTQSVRLPVPESNGMVWTIPTSSLKMFR
ncbi:MAG: KUP/HAK/KT family potassium transporter [Firmicutes bacterium]|nr:KUP/HAK/KT family potassium transporter [Bacillota bacterium]